MCAHMCTCIHLCPFVLSSIHLSFRGDAELLYHKLSPLLFLILINLICVFVQFMYLSLRVCAPAFMCTYICALFTFIF